MGGGVNGRSRPSDRRSCRPGDRDQAGDGTVVDYRLRLPNQKQEVVRRFK
jgi:hypothetical protein